MVEILDSQGHCAERPLPANDQAQEQHIDNNREVTAEDVDKLLNKILRSDTEQRVLSEQNPFDCTYSDSESIKATQHKHKKTRVAQKRVIALS